VTTHLQNFTKKDGNGKPKPDFKEIVKDKAQEEGESVPS
jgi:hypothetical protein